MVNSFSWFRHFALMHLVATNLAIWIRIMLWESAKDWLDAVHYKHNSSIKWEDAKFNISQHSLESDIKHTDLAKHKPYHRVHCKFAFLFTIRVDIQHFYLTSLELFNLFYSIIIPKLFIT